MPSPFRSECLPEKLWREKQAAHHARVDPWLAPVLARAARGEKHPVEDFLFTYYGHRPGHLRRWHPGLGVALEGEGAREFLSWVGYAERDGVVMAHPARVMKGRPEVVPWLLRLQRNLLDRPAFFGCFGLHEWAMVYRTPEKRHADWPLRLGSEGTDRVVESFPLRCSHFDAFRFFTPDSRPLNRLQPTRETIPENEQGGCVHANMDLYKWTFKLAPLVPSELMADAFELARDLRVLDMRASPYDIRKLGHEPIAIETPEGRVEYECQQRVLAERARPIRLTLIGLLERLSAGPG